MLGPLRPLSRGAEAQSVTVNATGCGFDPDRGSNLIFI